MGGVRDDLFIITAENPSGQGATLLIWHIDSWVRVGHNDGTRKNIMHFIQLTPFIRYVALSDDDGDLGIMLHTYNGQVLNAIEIHSREQFTTVYNELVDLTRPVEEVA